jgi:hypothetical protein
MGSVAILDLGVEITFISPWKDAGMPGDNVTA